MDDMTTTCISCSCPQGSRTGELHVYRVTSCVGDFHADDVVTLCDDCVRASGTAVASLEQIDDQS